MRLFKLLPFIAVLGGCVTAPQNLQVDEFALRSLTQIEASHYSCQCKIIRLGGKVITVENLVNRTKVEIMSLPVANYSAKPSIDSANQGRFIAYFNGFIDPKNLKDQYVTVVGTLKNQETGKIGEATYQYPVVAVRDYRIWKLQESYVYDDWDDYPYGYWGFRSRFRWHSHFHRKTIYSLY